MGIELMRKTAFACMLVLGTLLPSGAAPLGATEHVVRVISDYDDLQMSFHPKTLHIKPGDTVVWVNQDDEVHNMIAFPDGFPMGSQGFASPYLTKKEETWSYTFTAEGTYEYHCVPHMFLGMEGSIVVAEPSRDSEFHTPTKDEIKQYRNLAFEHHEDDEFDFVPRSQRGDL
jgi:plastocyanin